LCNLNPTKSPGLDCVHPRVLKECHEELAYPISVLFNLSIQAGKLPDLWKLAQVTPLFKKGDKKDSSNYRPVSLTIVLCKVLESFFRDAILDHMNRNKLFCDNQHGFRPQRSCVTQLLEVIEEWTDILDRGGNIDCIYLDFAKAFDTVPHQRLLRKIYAYGIKGNTYSWISNFLSNRKQQVRLGNSNSSWMDVKSGIPQGSVLGPILFLLFINDMPRVVNSVIKLFADDTKIYREISSEDDCKALQTDLDSLAAWSDSWQLRFNPSKCKCMHLGKCNPNVTYHISDNSEDIVVDSVASEKDLGVLFDNDLKFSPHIQQKVKKANQTLGMVKRAFDCLDKEVFIPIYKSLIRPHIEYASVIWKPYLKKDIIAIESVQRRATKIVTGLKDLTYEERLRQLGLPTLAYRRDRADMISLFKIMNNYDNVVIDTIKVAEPSSTRGHNLKLQKSRFSTRYGQHRFSTRVCNPWNSLTQGAVTASSVNSFKDNINQLWKHKSNKFSNN